MAEENKVNKPKATLIKHPRKAPEAAPVKTVDEKKPVEKKRVVVIKKKVVVKRPTITTPAEVPDDAKSEKIAYEKTRKGQPSQSENAELKSHSSVKTKKPDRVLHDKTGRQSKSGDQTKKKPEPVKSDVRRRTDFRSNQPRPAGIRVGTLHGKPVSNSDRPGNFRDQRGRTPARPGRPPISSGKGAPVRRSEPGRFNRSRPGGGEPSTIQENQKTVKKVFKPKNKRQRDFQKKREGLIEKDFQIKKKTINKTNPIPKKIDMMEVITVSELAKKMNLKASELIGKLMNMGMMVTINQQIDSETAQILASEYGCEVNVVSLYEETLIKTEDDANAELKHRPPIVTVMGHVDHGKTKLLDAIRETDVVSDEFGGITQHIGAYKVQYNDNDIVFLDTPGHSAFTLMRARGAQVTDIVILVVAANDGVMLQTKEAIDHAKEAGVPIIVAINKIDLPEANPERVKQQLSEYDLLPEDWGGSTLYCEISALKRLGIDELLDMILLQAEMLELDANHECRAEGKIIESKVDHGRGIVSTVIIQRGTLKVGDSFIAGVYSGKVRALFNDKGQKIDEATPSTPVEILGFTGIPNAGAPFQVTETEKIARQIGAKRQELERQGVANNVKKVTLDNLFDSIQEGEIQELKVIIKGDVHGSVEALQTSLEKLSTSEVRLAAIRASAGAIIEDDINLASASNAIIIGFNVRPTPKAKLLADREKIDIRKYNIIYDAVDDMKLAMEGLLAPDIKEEIIGKVEVRETFKVPKIGLIAGCFVLEGKVQRNASIHVIRDSVEQYTGKVTSLKRFKDDAREVLEGFECGLSVDSYQDIKVGDILEVFQIIEIAKKLT